MKILQVIHSFLPEGLGGSELYAYHLSLELAKKHEVIIFYRISDPNLKEYEIVRTEFNGLKVYKINNTWKDYTSFEDSYKNDALAKKFSLLLDELNPDLVHFHHLTCLSTTLIQEVKNHKKPVIFTLHDYWLICQRGQFLKRDLSICRAPSLAGCALCWAYQVKLKIGHKVLAKILDRLRPDFSHPQNLAKSVYSFINNLYAQFIFFFEKEALKQIKKRMIHLKMVSLLVDVFISPSNFLRNKHISFGIPQNKIVYIDHGINSDILEKKVSCIQGEVRFGYIGTLIPPKGIHLLVRAFKDVTKGAVLKIYGPEVVYEGYPDYVTELKNMALNSQIQFMGRYDQNDLPGILSEIDVLIIPSIWYENSPLTIKEAFVRKIPVITTRLGGMQEYVKDGENGLLFALGSSDDLRKKINKLIFSPELVRILSEGIKPIKSVVDNVDEISKVYVNLVNCSKKLLRSEKC